MGTDRENGRGNKSTYGIDDDNIDKNITSNSVTNILYVIIRNVYQ
jgi:hypothetical protein